MKLKTISRYMMHSYVSYVIIIDNDNERNERGVIL